MEDALNSMGTGDSVPTAVLEEAARLPKELIDPNGVMGVPGILPGYDGLPFRGKKIPDVKEDDPDRKKPQQGIQVHLDILHMNNKEDRERYTSIMQLVVNGFGQVGLEEVVNDEKNNSWRILLRWYELYSHLPRER